MLRRLLYAAVAAGVLLGCDAGQGGVRSGASDTAAVGPPAHRVVSLSPSLTELIFTVGGGSRLVGRTRWDTDPPEARAVPSVGDGLEPNLELILARTPDLVVFYDTPANAAAIARLRAAGIATLSLRMDRLEDVPVAARLLGDALGVRPTADSVAEAFETVLQRRRRAVNGPGPGVLILTWDSPPIVIGGGSFLTELVALAGGHNVFADLTQPSAPVSLEAIAERNPDVVLLAGGQAPGFVDRPEWQAVPAVRARRFARVEGSAFSWPSPRSLAAVDRLAAAIAEAGR